MWYNNLKSAHTNREAARLTKKILRRLAAILSVFLIIFGSAYYGRIMAVHYRSTLEGTYAKAVSDLNRYINTGIEMIKKSLDLATVAD
jgi:hypothetical protein